MLKKLKSIDIYGHPIGVLYKGSTTYQTLFGSIFTLLTTATVLIFASSKMTEIIQHTDQSVNTRTIIADIDKVGKVDLEKLNFNLLFQVIAQDFASGEHNFSYKIPPEVGRFQVQMITRSEEFQEVRSQLPLRTIDDYESHEVFYKEWGVSEA